MELNSYQGECGQHSLVPEMTDPHLASISVTPSAGLHSGTLAVSCAFIFSGLATCCIAEIMNSAMAAPEEPNLQPQPMSNWSAFFYFAGFVLVVAYTLLNLYIGVVFYQFSRIRMQSQTGDCQLLCFAVLSTGTVAR